MAVVMVRLMSPWSVWGMSSTPTRGIMARLTPNRTMIPTSTTQRWWIVQVRAAR